MPMMSNPPLTPVSILKATERVRYHFDRLLACCTRVIEIPLSINRTSMPRPLPAPVTELKIVQPRFHLLLQHKARTLEECIAYADGYLDALEWQIHDRHVVAAHVRFWPEMDVETDFASGVTWFKVYARATFYDDLVVVKVTKDV